MDFPDPKYREICSSATLYSSKQGFFSALSASVIDKIGNDWINTSFASQKLEEDKIRICYADSHVWGIIHQALNNVKKVYRQKCGSSSKESHLKGDKLFNENDFKRAIMFYSQSIIRSPGAVVDCSVDNGPTLSSAYKSRSDCFYHLQMYKECLTDLNLAIKEGLPISERYKVYKKMGQCYKQLQDEKKAKISFQVALNLVEEQLSNVVKSDKQMQYSQNNKKSIAALKKERKDIKKFLMDLSDNNNVKVVQLPRFLTLGGPAPEIAGPANDKYRSATKRLTIKKTAEEGRFAVAVDKIDTGSVVVVEEPFASCLIPEMFSSHCHHCFSKLNSALPCNTCSGVAFCSVECQASAISTYHKYECQFLGLFIGSGMSVLSFLSLRMITQENITFFKQLYEKIKDLKSGSKKDVNFTDKEIKYMNVYNLVGHSQTRMNMDYFKRVLMSFFLVKCLKKTDFFGTEENRPEELSEDEILTTSLVLRHLQVLQFNAHEIYETKLEKMGKTKGSKCVYIAVGIYPVASLFNHECAPAVTRYFYKKSIVLKAIRPIKVGEIISENYGPVFSKKTLPQRTRELTSRYWFRCTCSACVEDWPTLDNLTRQHLRLSCRTENCTGLLSYPLSAKKSRLEPRCTKCFNKVNLTGVLQRESQVQSLFHKGIEEMDNENCENAVALLENYMNQIFKLGVPPCREISLCQEALRICYAQLGNICLCDY